MAGRDQILQRIRGHPKIPAPPQVVFRVLEMTNDSDCHVGKLADVISHDGGLTAQLLRQANSAMFARAKPTSSVADACTALGLKRVRAAVVNQHVVNGLTGVRPAGFDPDRYWQTAFAISVAAHDLAMQVLPAMAPDATTAGLLSDLGVGILAFCLPVEYASVLDLCRHGSYRELARIEARTLGVTHAEVGAELFADWKLDQHIVEAVRRHHTDPDESDFGPHPEFARVVAAAVCLSEIAMHGSDMDRVAGLFAHLDRLTDKADAVVQRLLDELVARIQEAARTFSVELGGMDAMQASFAKLAEAAPARAV